IRNSNAGPEPGLLTITPAKRLKSVVTEGKAADRADFLHSDERGAKKNSNEPCHHEVVVAIDPALFALRHGVSHRISPCHEGAEYKPSLQGSGAPSGSGSRGNSVRVQPKGPSEDGEARENETQFGGQSAGSLNGPTVSPRRFARNEALPSNTQTHEGR